ncbi:MAG: AMP-binding protein, partial [Promethearchaeota archaeon]
MTEKSPYASKIWLKSYDDHVKPELNFELISLDEMMKCTVKEFPDSLCYDFQTEKVTFQEAEKQVISFANFLIENGLKKGDRIAIMLPNLPQYFIGLWGTFYAGCTSMGMNFLLQVPEIIYQLKDSGAVVLLTLDSFYEEKVRNALETGKTDVKIVITTNVADVLSIDETMKEQLIKLGRLPFGEVIPIDTIRSFSFKDILNKYPNDEAPLWENDPKNDIAFLQYTGGTTGPPKGAILTHENILYNIKHTFNWFEPGAHRGQDMYMSGFPFFHLAGMSLNYAAVHSGAAQIFIPDPRDTAYFINKAKEYQDKINLLANVPTLYLMIMADRKFKRVKFRDDVGFISGAAPFPSESIMEFEEIV